jgi:uncharacterized membrane protein (UPF0136 family)
LTSSGISTRQGAHQRAQKFTISGLPRGLSSATGLSSLLVSFAANRVVRGRRPMASSRNEQP